MERDILVRLTFKGGPRYSVRTEPKWSGPFDFLSKFPEFWAEWKPPLITPLPICVPMSSLVVFSLIASFFTVCVCSVQVPTVPVASPSNSNQFGGHLEPRNHVPKLNETYYGP